MKLEVGMHIRIKNKAGWCCIGNIYNINDFREPSMKYCVDIQSDDFIFIDEEMIAKASHNIIDLIEKHDVLVIKELDGDLVKYEVEGIKRQGCDFETLGVVIRERFYSLVELEPNIKEILTKEQFESMSYKVGD